MKRILSLFIVLATVSGCSKRVSGGPPKSKTEAQSDIAVVVSPFLKTKAETVRTLAFWGFRQAGTNITWFDGFNATEITRFNVPTLNYYSDEAVAERIGRPAQIIEDWSRGPADGTLNPNALSIANSFLRVPQNLQRAPERLMIVGSPMGRNWGTRYPALGQLTHPDSEFSSWGRETSLQGTQVFWQFPIEETFTWPARLEERLREFYSELCQSRGAKLVYFGPDLSAMLAAVARPVRSEPANNNWKTNTPSLAMLDTIPKPAAEDVVRKIQPQITPINSTLVKVATLTNSHPLAATNTIAVITVPPAIRSAPKTNVAIATAAAARPSDPKPTPVFLPSPSRIITSVPRPQIGVTVAIAYRSRSAVADLYLRPERASREISARTSRRDTERGTYAEGYDSKTGESIKWVWLPAGLDRAKAELFINYSSGAGDLSGRILWLSPTGDAEMPFAFATTSGRLGGLRSGPCWLWKNLVNLNDQTFAQASRTQ